jgi:hypothetical protein
MIHIVLNNNIKNSSAFIGREERRTGLCHTKLFVLCSQSQHSTSLKVTNRIPMFVYRVSKKKLTPLLFKLAAKVSVFFTHPLDHVRVIFLVQNFDFFKFPNVWADKK